jgi:hypothetical protein
MQNAEPWTTRRIANVDIDDDLARLQGKTLTMASKGGDISTARQGGGLRDSFCRAVLKSDLPQGEVAWGILTTTHLQASFREADYTSTCRRHKLV